MPVVPNMTKLRANGCLYCVISAIFEVTNADKINTLFWSERTSGYSDDTTTTMHRYIHSVTETNRKIVLTH